MNLCFFQPNAETFSPLFGGVNRVMNLLKIYFEKEGYSIYFLSNGTKLDNYELRNNEFFLSDNNVTSKQNIDDLKKFLVDKKIDIFLNNAALSKDAVKVAKAIHGYCRVIHLHHNCVSCLYNNYPHLFQKSKPLYLSEWITKLKLWSFVKWTYRIRTKWLWNESIKCSDAFFLIFDSFIRELEELYSIKSNKLFSIVYPPSFLSGELDLNLGLKKNVVYVGRIIEPQKRCDKLMELWRRLHDTHKDWTFSIVGEGDFWETAKQYAIDHGLDRIVFHGIQNPLPHWLNADLFTLTSDFEGFGMVLLEAQVSGTVPITFNCFSAINEVVLNENSGLIIDDFDIDEMFHKTSDLMRNHDRILELKRGAVKHAQKFDINITGKKWIEKFKEVMKSDRILNQ